MCEFDVIVSVVESAELSVSFIGVTSWIDASFQFLGGQMVINLQPTKAQMVVVAKVKNQN